MINNTTKFKIMKTITEYQLRLKISEMSKNDMIKLRDELENNWNENLRPLMQVLSLGCLMKFKVTLVSL